MTLDQIIEKNGHLEGPLLPIFLDVQSAFGCISDESIRGIAHALNLTRAEVHGVASFYHDFTQKRDDRPLIKSCVAEACKARGGDAVYEAAVAAAGARVRVEKIYCLGLCSVGPAALSEGKIYARLTPDGAQTIVNSL
jgi:formate dehydrogenase subunit gamma